MNAVTEIIRIVTTIGFKPIPLNEENNFYYMTNTDVNNYLLSLYLFINEKTNRITFTCPFPHHIAEENFEKALIYINKLNIRLGKGTFILKVINNEVMHKINLSYSNTGLDKELINNLLWTCFDNVERYHLGLLGYLEKNFTLDDALLIEYNRHLTKK